MEDIQFILEVERRRLRTPLLRGGLGPLQLSGVQFKGYIDHLKILMNLRL